MDGETQVHQDSSISPVPPAAQAAETLAEFLRTHDPAWTPRAVATGTAMVTGVGLLLSLVFQYLACHQDHTLGWVLSDWLTIYSGACAALVLVTAFLLRDNDANNEVRRRLFGVAISVLLLEVGFAGLLLFVHYRATAG